MCHYFHDFGDFHEIMIFMFFTFFVILIIFDDIGWVFTKSSTFRPVGGFCQNPYKPKSSHFPYFLIFGDPADSQNDGFDHFGDVVITKSDDKMTLFSCFLVTFCTLLCDALIYAYMRCSSMYSLI